MKDLSAIGAKELLSLIAAWVGCNGQLGRALVTHLQKDGDKNNVIGVDVRTGSVPNCFIADVTKYTTIKDILDIAQPHWVIHLPAILSGQAEASVSMAKRALQVNSESFIHLLRLGKQRKFRLFCPSTIAAFGPDTPKEMAPNHCLMRPRYLYGITKLYNELLGSYFHQRYGVDYRAMRLPGLLTTIPSVGTGTTDYAIEMIRAAMTRNMASPSSYKCYLRADTMLPMLHIDDCVNGVIKLMETDRDRLTQCVYNVQGLSFDPQGLYQELIQQLGSDLQVFYHPDYRQAIADTWPHSLDDRLARSDWAWAPKIISLPQLVASLSEQVGKQ